MEHIEGARTILEHSGDTCLIVIGGVHGNEPAGIRAIERLSTLIENDDWKVDCSIYGLIGNPRAVEKNVRFVDENLNRAFGRSIQGSYEHTRAQEIGMWLAHLAQRHPRAHLLDLHSVSIGETCMAITLQDAQKKVLQSVSPIPFKLIAPPEVIPGTLVGYAESLGMTGLVIECGNHSSPHGESVAMEHIERVLEHLHALVRAATSFKQVNEYDGPMRTYRLTAPIKPGAAFVWTIPVSSELFVTRGAVFAKDDTGHHVAPEDSFIIMPSKIPEPSDYDAGFLAQRLTD
jgi:succinylglutamate desuccinylase